MPAVLDPPPLSVPTRPAPERDEEMLWTRELYEAAIDAGIIEGGAKVELLDGKILTMSVQKPAHSFVLRVLQIFLEKLFVGTHDIRAQLPLALDDYSEPEPGIAVVKGSHFDYATKHPRTAELIIEISDTTLARDKQTKKAAYARNGIPEYWIVNLVERQLEVYRQPQGTEYLEGLILKPGRAIAPLGRENALVKVENLLPPQAE